jgi:hypothetical protein
MALGVPALRADAPPSLQSNLMNPLISLNALFLGDASPDRAKGTYTPTGDIANDGKFVRESGQRYSFGLQESELTVESVVDSYFKLNANLVFADDEVTPEEVFATTRSLPQVQVKLGKFKTAFGKLGYVHAHAFPFILGALAYEHTIGGEGFNGEGAEAAWMTPLPWYLELTGGGYKAQTTDGTMDLSGLRKDDFVYLAHMKNFFDLAGNASLEVGGSLLAGKTALGESQRTVGVDLTVKNAPPRNAPGHWVFQNEWLQKSTGDVKQQEGFYSALQYRMASDWWLGARTERVIRESGTAYVAMGTQDANGQDLYEAATGDERRHTLELTWAPGEFTAIRADYSYGTIHSVDGRELDRRFLIQFNHTIGTHPAHNF